MENSNDEHKKGVKTIIIDDVYEPLVSHEIENAISEIVERKTIETHNDNTTIIKESHIKESQDSEDYPSEPTPITFDKLQKAQNSEAKTNAKRAFKMASEMRKKVEEAAITALNAKTTAVDANKQAVLSKSVKKIRISQRKLHF